MPQSKESAMAVFRYAIYPPPRPEFPHLVVMMVGDNTTLVGAAKTKAEATTIYEAAVLRRERFDAARKGRLARPHKAKK
jgi:hypothetical protein